MKMTTINEAERARSRERGKDLTKPKKEDCAYYGRKKFFEDSINN